MTVRQPDLRFPKALSSAELEAAYRFLNNVKVQPREILEFHERQTVQRIANAVTLVAHDIILSRSNRRAAPTLRRRDRATGRPRALRIGWRRGLDGAADWSA